MESGDNMSFYNRYTAKYEADPTLSPFGTITASMLLFEDYPIFRAVGPLSIVEQIPAWSVYMVRSDFARDELTKVTLEYANNRGGIFHDGDSRGWYCYAANSVEAAYLAWDFPPFLERIHWTAGIGVVRPDNDPNWINVRRDWCEDILTAKAPDFLPAFYAQFKGVSQDKPI